MPELPEVQTVVDGLNQKMVGHTILDLVYCDAPKLIHGATLAGFKKEVTGQKIVRVTRRAKNILIYLSGGKILHVHLKMTGHLIVKKDTYKVVDGKWQGSNLPPELTDPINQFIHIVFLLSGGLQLAYSDMRKFGFFHLIDTDGVLEVDERHGPEPVYNPDFTLEVFRVILKKYPNNKIKALLLDQQKIAGIGNIYGDEILFLARVLPDRKAGSLSTIETKRVYENIEPVLLDAIKKRGTSIGDFRDSDGRIGSYQESRLVYGREGQSCGVCGSIIKRIKIGQRSAHFCSTCQK
ncbi:MAG: bifunctional DNA-formamidopyrimidine glycosylase/DNA-(apurinic or apyrimidinic site) lyase [Patescibacteria group bacterium]